MWSPAQAYAQPPNLGRVTNAERYAALSLPMTVALVDSELDASGRRSARVALEALEAIGEAPELVLGTRGGGVLAGCRRAIDCGDGFSDWLSLYPRADSAAQGLDRVFDVGAPPASLTEVVHHLERLRRTPIRSYDGLSPVKIWIFGTPLSSRAPLDRIRLDDLVVVPPMETVADLVELVCDRTSEQCVSPAPPIERYPGQRGVRIFADDDGRPVHAEPVAVGDRFSSDDDAIDVAILTPYVAAMSLEWSGGGRVFAHLVGRRTDEVGDGYYDFDITMDGEPLDHVFDGASLVATLPPSAPGHHVVRARIAGGHLTTPIVDAIEHDVDWIVELGTLAPGDLPRCVPVAPGFGPIGELPAFVHVTVRDDEICGSVSLATMSTRAEWPQWRGEDGVAREIRFHSAPSPIFWVFLIGLFLAATHSTRKLVHLLFLRRRPTHLVVARRDDASYRDAGGPERVIALSEGAMKDLAPELAEIDATIEIGAFVTVTSAEPFLVKLRSTGVLHRARRAALPAGSAIAVGEIQIAFVDEATANRLTAREFRALPVFSSTERESHDGHEQPREVGPVGEAAVYAILITAVITGFVALLSTIAPFAGTYPGFVGMAALLLAAGYLVARALLSRA